MKKYTSEDERICPCCNISLPLNFFRTNARTKKYPDYCLKCRDRQRKIDTGKIWHTENKDRLAAYYRKKNYGLECEEFEDLVQAQHGKCAICGRLYEPDAAKRASMRMTVDHGHTTGKVRGLLCGSCNAGLGGFSDNPQLLQNAIAYLVHHQKKYKGKKPKILQTHNEQTILF